MLYLQKKEQRELFRHYIREAQRVAILMDNLRRVTHFAKQNELLFERHITKKSGIEIRREIARTEREPEALKGSVVNVSAFIEKAKQYTEVNALTIEILNLFIERVEVGEREEK